MDEGDPPQLRQLLVLLLKIIDEVKCKTTIRKLKRMLFGPTSETRHLEPEVAASFATPNDESGPATARAAASADELWSLTGPQPRRPGRGRNR